MDHFDYVCTNVIKALINADRLSPGAPTDEEEDSEDNAEAEDGAGQDGDAEMVNGDGDEAEADMEDDEPVRTDVTL